MIPLPRLAAFLLPVVAFAVEPVAGRGDTARFVEEWQVLGPFPYGTPEEGRLDRAPIGSEETLAPSPEPVGGRRWTKASARAGLLRFGDLFAPEPYERSTAYAAVFVRSPVGRWTTVGVGSDDGVSVRVNGLLFHSNDVPRGHSFGADRVKVRLKRGWNRLLFKVVNGNGAFDLSANLEDAADLEFAVDPPVDRWIGPPEPPDLFVRTIEAATPVMTIGSRAYRFTFEIANAGGQEAAQALVELRRADGSAARDERLFAIEPWTSRRVEFFVRPRDFVDSAGRLPTLVLTDDSGPRTQVIDGFDARAALARLHGPYEVRDSELAPDKISVGAPPEFAGLTARASVRLPGPADLLVNDRAVVPTFRGDSGWFSLGEPRDGMWSLTLKADRRQDVQVLVRFEDPDLDRAVADARAAAELGSPVERAFERLLAAVASGKRETIDAEAAKIRAEAKERVGPAIANASLLFAGNAHIDLAWLWRIPETKQVCRDTFRSALDYMRRYPDFTFSHGQAQSYAWMEEEEPALFAEIKERVKEGRWEVVGGSWGESDTNMPTGESLVRQWLYGKRYFQEKFGVDVKVGWLPDTFGHPAMLPTILKGCGVESFVFFRPWDKARTFRWQGPDGSEVTAVRPPRWYMVEADGIDAPLGKEAVAAAEKTGHAEQLVLVGVGDHGGGPTRDAIEKAALFDSLEAFPSVKFGRAHDFFERLATKGKVEDAYRGEINFVFPGCWTSQGDHKRNNRRAEHALPAAETLAALASLHGFEVPRGELTDGWRLTLLNQFHDLLCGSGIDEIYDDAAKQYEEVFDIARRTTTDALGLLASKIDTASVAPAGRAIVVWNPLPWERTDLVEAWLVSDGTPSVVYDENGSWLTPMIREEAGKTARVSFVARGVPGCGWRTYRVGPPAGEPARRRAVHDLLVDLGFDEAEGRLRSLFAGSERLVGAGGEVRVYEDRGNAWELPIEGAGAALAERTAIAWSETEGGTVTGKHERSLVSQDFEFRDGLGRVDALVRLDWKDPNRAVKIAWPFAVEGAKATFEIPFGSIERPADGKEVPAIRWVDVSNAERGVAILNDGRYGFDVNGSTIRITAHRAPTDPGKTAGIGSFEFRYAVVPHEGDWRAAEIPKRAVEFNTPLAAWVADAHKGEWPATHSLLSVEGSGVIASAFKKAEDGDAFVLRVYEAHGREATAKVRLPFVAKKVEVADHLERPRKDAGVRGESFEIRLRAHEVATLRISK